MTEDGKVTKLPRLRTADEIQETLIETIRKLQAGEITPKEANAITRQAGAVIAAARAAIRSGGR